MIRSEFKVHRLTESGLRKAGELADVFSDALVKVEGLCGTNGREIAIVRTKLQEANFFAKRALAQLPEYQADGPGENLGSAGLTDAKESAAG